MHRVQRLRHCQSAWWFLRDKGVPWARANLAPVAGLLATAAVVFLFVRAAVILLGAILRSWPIFLMCAVLLAPPVRSRLVCAFAEHVYSGPLGKLHLWLLTARRGRQYHVRFADLRVDARTRAGAPASVHAIPQLRDNYAYLVVDRLSMRPYPAVLVDPSDALTVVDALRAIQRIHYDDDMLDVQAILTTHRHWSHQGANLKLLWMLPTIRYIYGGAQEGVLGVTNEVSHGAFFSVGALDWEVLAMPGHTRGGVAYCLRGAEGRDCLMTGDALFGGGTCGARLEGGQGEQQRGLLTVLRECSDQTLLFPGHEYTSRSLRASRCAAERHFSEGSPGGLLDLSATYLAALHREKHCPTVPLCLGEERQLETLAWGQLRRHARVLAAAAEHRRREAARAAAQAEPAAAPQAVLPTALPEDRVPQAGTFAAVYLEDLERIEEELASGEMAAMDAAEALRAARRRAASPLAPPGDAAAPAPAELRESLRVLGVPAEVAIDRGGADGDALAVSLDDLVAALHRIGAEAEAGAVAEAMSNFERWSGVEVGVERRATVAQIAGWLLPSYEADGVVEAPPTVAAGAARSAAPLQAAWAVLRLRLRGAWRLCRAEGVRRLALLRGALRMRPGVPAGRLLEPPAHDVAACAVCSRAWSGVPAGRGAMVQRRPPAPRPLARGAGHCAAGMASPLLSVTEPVAMR